MSSSGKVAVVLGAGRSMTSGVAKGLHLAGFPMASRESDLIGPGPGNEYGHYEDRRLVDLNDRILSYHGGTWDNPPPSIFNISFTEQIDAYIRSRGPAPWGMKDPRLVITWPLWRRAFDTFDFDLILIKVEREPARIAESMTDRDGSNYYDNVLLAHKYQRIMRQEI